MPRYNNINGTMVQCIAEEETYFDALKQNHIETAVARASAEVREKRDRLLAATDWTASSDLTMSSDMTTYRQYLRDIPKKPGFPTSMAWPTKP